MSEHIKKEQDRKVELEIFVGQKGKHTHTPSQTQIQVEVQINIQIQIHTCRGLIMCQAKSCGSSLSLRYFPLHALPFKRHVSFVVGKNDVPRFLCLWPKETAKTQKTNSRGIFGAQSYGQNNICTPKHMYLNTHMLTYFLCFCQISNNRFTQVLCFAGRAKAEELLAKMGRG